MIGSIIVAGSAPSVREDVRDAKQLRPNVPILAVNYAIRALPEADFCYVGHIEFDFWRELAGDRPLYARSPGPKQREVTGPKSDHPEIDLWIDTPGIGGGSGISAALAAKALGYSEIILCGCGMDWREGYVDDFTVVFSSTLQRSRVTPGQRAGLRAAIERGVDFSGIVSMSGYTREVFGGPKE
tara:strand:+ start:9104 stop:9655 length:552 start_codon:yes stop_codon:yes gene_type:complete